MKSRKQIFILVAVFVALLGAVTVTLFNDNSPEEGQLPSYIVDVDTNSVFEVQIYPASENQQQIRFYKSDTAWIVSKSNIMCPITNNDMAVLLREITRIRPVSVVSENRELWDQMELTDAKTTRMKLIGGKGEILAEACFGKVDVEESGQMEEGFAVKPKGKTYVRIAGDDRVFVINGFLGYSLKRPFNNWRNMTLARFDTGQVSSITFSYPSDTGFVIKKEGSEITLNNNKCNAEKVLGYLKWLSVRNCDKFYDNAPLPVKNPFIITLVSGKQDTIRIQSWPASDTLFYLKSSQNPGVLFLVTESTYIKWIFRSKKDFQ